MGKVNTTKTGKPVLITGGAGFIGTNLADKLIKEGYTVRIFDNLSRNGVEQNLNWLCEKYKDKVQIIIGDIRNYDAILKAVKNVDSVFHFAAQSAITSSFVNPIDDFETNVKGTINLLEAVKNSNPISSFVFTSTNKVYGELNDIIIRCNDTRYYPVDESIAKNGIDENRKLNFYSPYGCSKGAADQYILDYYKSFNLPTVVFRMSCVYGPHQFGNEDQGWIAHFMINALKNKTITIYGDGKQVRDILYIDDLLNAFIGVKDNISKLAGNAFNVGGGINNTISLLELLNIIKSFSKIKMDVLFDDWRFGDQKYYVANIRKISNAISWKPLVNVKSGLINLMKWLVVQEDISKGKKNKIISNLALEKVKSDIF